MTTTPGSIREGNWLKAPNGADVRVCVVRGYDCRERCQHVPPQPNEGGQNHGQHCDEWRFQYRSGDVAAELVCYSWIRNGAIIAGRPKDGRQLIYGAMLFSHHKADDGEKCPILGLCKIDGSSFLFAAEFFEEAHAAALLPLAMHPVDEIDLDLAADVVPVWGKLAAFL